MIRCLCTVVSLVCLYASAAGQDWQDQIRNLIKASTSSEQELLIAGIVAQHPDWRQLREQINRIAFSDTLRGQLMPGKVLGSDGVTRAYAIYVPSGYDPQVPCPFLVHLHGIVMRQNIDPNPHNYVGNDTLMSLAEKHGWILLFPFGQAGASWFDEVGMSNVTSLVRTIKTHFNIEDDRVYLSGFSDGASGAFLFAMVKPNDFGAFVALNGSIGGGSEDDGFSTYAPNLSNTFLYVTTADRDRYYPTSQFQRTIAMAEAAGARILYRRLTGDHISSAAMVDYSEIFDYLTQHPRNPRPDTIVWETAAPEFGRCRWLAIDAVTTGDPADWHVDHNVALIDSSVSVGIQPNDTFAGPGVMVASVSKGDCLARRLGLETGDIIIRGNDVAINGLGDLAVFRKSLQRGTPATAVVKRAGSEVVLRGQVPLPRTYFIFKRDRPSALVRATFANNEFDISGSRVGALRLFIDPLMIDLSRNVVVRFDGRIIFDERVVPDIGYQLRDFLASRDRSRTSVAEISLRLTK